MKMKICALFCLLGLAASAALPRATDVSFTYRAHGRYRITYALDRDAVVTLDVKANGVSLGTDAVKGATGDVWREVTAGTDHLIVWDAGKSVPGFKTDDFTVEVVAWALTDKPDVMTVDLNAAADERIRYYPTVGHLPGGLLENPAYRTSTIVMKRVHAKNYPWITGGDSDGGSATEKTRVTLTNDYYMALFETTQSCWTNVYGAFTSSVKPYFGVDGDMRPVENMVSYYRLRENTDNSTANPAYEWPNDPCPDSFLGKLRTRTGLDFDLPSEAEWEFAARAGVPFRYYNTGWECYLVDDGSDMPGRCQSTGARHTEADTKAGTVTPEEGGTARVGSYAPSRWGFYDFHGNVCELCLDWHASDITALKGAVNANGAYLADGETLGVNRVYRGRGFNEQPKGNQLPSKRGSFAPKKTDWSVGFRLKCRNGLE